MTEEHKAQTAPGQTEHAVGAIWLTEKTGDEIDPVSKTGEGAGFVFNFHIPAEMTGETDTDGKTGTDNGLEVAVASIMDKGPTREGCIENPNDIKQNLEHPPSKAKKTKKKKSSSKKCEEEGKGKQQKPSLASQEGAASQAVKADKILTSDQQLARELDWCIEQLELGLRTRKPTPKQVEEASHALKTLRSNKAPLVKKRQVMRNMLGDYRKKMDEENAKQIKLIQGAVKSSRIMAVSEPVKRPVFHRRARDQNQLPQPCTWNQEENPDTHSERFVFTTTQEEFCFNFF